MFPYNNVSYIGHCSIWISNWTPWKMLDPLPPELVFPEINHWTPLSNKFRTKQINKNVRTFISSVGPGHPRFSSDERIRTCFAEGYLSLWLLADRQDCNFFCITKLLAPAILKMNLLLIRTWGPVYVTMSFLRQFQLRFSDFWHIIYPYTGTWQPIDF